MGGACSTHGRYKECIENISKNIGVDGRMILKWIEFEVMDWIHLV
jgi:hypothetical protein